MVCNKVECTPLNVHVCTMCEFHTHVSVCMVCVVWVGMFIWSGGKEHYKFRLIEISLVDMATWRQHRGITQ